MKKKLMSLAAILVLSLVCAFALPAVTGMTKVTAYADNYDNIYTVRVSDGYLALRNAKAFDYNNEIGKLYTGDTVSVLDTSDSTYWYVYSSSLNKYGYVNKNYLYKNGGSYTMTVKVSDGYLALRTAKAFDYNNEIGKLYTGDTVEVMDNSDATYWYVYAPSLGKSGYVNRNYLYNKTPTGTDYTVYVSDGYLALRNAKAFDYNNEIGKLYTGDTVKVQDTSDGQYWYVYAPSLGKYGYVNKDYIYKSGSSPSPSPSPGPTPPTDYFERTVSVSDGYLALRTAPAYDYSNEIGALYSGSKFWVTDSSGSQYWYGYAPSLGKYGYVNKDYLYGSSPSPSPTTMTVSVSSGYLALRSAKAFDYSNEIGRLYSGDTVQISDTSDSQYWYVYAPSLGKYGYVNKDYLY